MIAKIKNKFYRELTEKEVEDLKIKIPFHDKIPKNKRIFYVRFFIEVK